MLFVVIGALRELRQEKLFRDAVLKDVDLEFYELADVAGCGGIGVKVDGRDRGRDNCWRWRGGGGSGGRFPFCVGEGSRRGPWRQRERTEARGECWFRPPTASGVTEDCDVGALRSDSLMGRRRPSAHGALPPLRVDGWGGHFLFYVLLKYVYRFRGTTCVCVEKTLNV